MEPEEDVAATVTEGEPFDPSEYDPEAFDEFVGRYALDSAPAFILTFTREGETLHTPATGQQRLEIVPTSDSTFALIVVEASIEFHRNADGEVDALTMNHAGQQQRANRLDPEPSTTSRPEACRGPSSGIATTR